MDITGTLRRGFGHAIPVSLGIAVLTAISPLRAEPLATRADTVVVVVSAASPVTQISRLHLADLYMGRTTRFPDGAPATPIDQKAGSVDRVTFSSTFLGRTEAQMKSHWSKLIFTGRGRPPVEAPTAAAMKKLVSGNPRAIGYLDAHLMDSSLRAVRVE